MAIQSQPPSHYTTIIVGAGPQGLSAARTFLACTYSCTKPPLPPPSPASPTSLLVLDPLSAPGGVWAPENMYPSLRTNNMLGTYQFPDYPMTTERYGVKPGEHIPGEVVGRYLRDWVQKWRLGPYLRFGIKVVEVEEVQGLGARGRNGWVVRCIELESSKQILLTCEELVIATGLTSTPLPQRFPGSETFKSPMVPFSQLARRVDVILADEQVKQVVVHGASKGAYDCVHLFASTGRRVHWVIRASGYGPTYMAPAHIWLGPVECWLEKLTTTRVWSWFSPCVWGDADGFGRLRGVLHGSELGRWLVRTFWGQLTLETLKQSGLGRAKEEGMEALVPEQSAFWFGTNIGILNYPTDIYDFVRSGQVKIIRKDIRDFKETEVVFADGQTVRADAFIYHAGWKFTPGVKMMPEEKLAGWGVPSEKYSKTQKEDWRQMDMKADIDILERFPMLAEGPQASLNPLLVNASALPSMPQTLQTERGDSKTDEEYAPWRLWRGIAPPSQVATGERNLVILGMNQQFQGSVRSEIAGLWAYAYLHGMLESSLRSLSSTGGPLMVDVNSEEGGKLSEHKSSDDAIKYDTALFNRFGKWRCPLGQGARYPDFVFDAVPYFDLLLGDLGLKYWRKGWGIVGEIFGGGYGPEDYTGLIEEWLARKRPGQ